MLQQELPALVVLGQVERGPVLALGVQVGAALEQELHDARVALRGRRDERRMPATYRHAASTSLIWRSIAAPEAKKASLSPE